MLGGGVLGESNDAMLGRRVRAVADGGDGTVNRRHVYDRTLTCAGFEHAGI